jgi:hypothetical protein
MAVLLRCGIRGISCFFALWAAPWLIFWAGCAAPPSELKAPSPPPAADLAPRQAAAALPAEVAGLRVEVVPARGMSVWLDGIRRATSSPYQALDLPPGPHDLHVQAMGHHSLSLPLVLQAKEVLHVPVALRRRSVAEVAATAPRWRILRGSPRPPPPSGGRTAAPVLAVPPVATAAGRPPASELPEGLDALLLQFRAEPVAPVRLDDLVLGRGEVRLRRTAGLLQVGALRIAYTISPTRMLELEVPADDADWFKDGSQAKQGSLLRLGLGASRLRRVARDGSSQSVLIKRVL